MHLLMISIAFALPDIWSDFQEGDYTLVYDEAAFTGVIDRIARMCYNDNTLQGYNDEKASWCMQIESEYYDSNCDCTSSEWIVSWNDNSNTQVRPLQLNCMWETGLCSLRTEGQLELRRTDGLEGWRMDENLRLRAVNGFLSNWVNNDKWIFQKDASGIERSLIWRRDRNVVLGENGDQVSMTGDLMIGAETDASAMLHVQKSIVADAMYIPFRLQPTVTTSNDVYGWWQHLTVNINDGAYPSSMKAMWVDPPNIALGSGSDVWETTTLYIGGASTTGHKNYALHISGSSALSKIDGVLRVGVLQLGDLIECSYFDEDTCFLLEDDEGTVYEIPAHQL